MAGASNGELAMMRARVPSGARRLVSSRRERLGRGAFGQPDREGEDRPSAGIVGEGQFASHEADKLARDRKPEPRALEAARVRAVALLETVENRRPAVRGHAWPGVDHREPRHAHCAALDRNADAALIGEFDRVAGEVGEDLAQAQAITANEARRAGAERAGDLDAFALGARREQFDHALSEPTQIDRLHDEIEAAGFDLGQIEDFVDQRDECAPRAADRFDIACVFEIERGLPQQVGHAENAADRGADLVAHRGQKARFGLARRLRPVARAGRFLEPPELIAQRFVLGGDPCRARFGLAPGAGDRGGERERQGDHRAGLNPERMNPEIRQTGAQIHSQSRSARPRADKLCGPWFQAALVIVLRNSAKLYASASIPALTPPPRRGPARRGRRAPRRDGRGASGRRRRGRRACGRA